MHPGIMGTGAFSLRLVAGGLSRLLADDVSFFGLIVGGTSAFAGSNRAFDAIVRVSSSICLGFSSVCRPRRFQRVLSSLEGASCSTREAKMLPSVPCTATKTNTCKTRTWVTTSNVSRSFVLSFCCNSSVLAITSRRLALCPPVDVSSR
ncbi:hypothetical protein PR003_g22629 [Phytophthora rubi]|uniref:Uncharacterized protein n=1 Tax=Phytophthora rubi TaxID=129364 RepID=A0A6A4D322_9STRA|nr:hypothetical protein PR003_g22629 [Phytophthora rubi]